MASRAGCLPSRPVEDTYTARETAGGNLNIADGVSTIVKTIEGSTKSTGKNLFGLTADDFKNGTIDGAGKRVNLNLMPNTQYTLSSNAPKYNDIATSIWFNGGDSTLDGVWENQPRTVITDANGNLYITIRLTEIDTIFNNYWIMLNEGKIALPYQPYFKGLKMRALQVLSQRERICFQEKT